jgi:hypothetical protein
MFMIQGASMGKEYEKDLVYRLRKRAEIRRQAMTRESVQEGKPDRIADLLEEAAEYIEDAVGEENTTWDLK